MNESWQSRYTRLVGHLHAIYANGQAGAEELHKLPPDLLKSVLAADPQALGGVGGVGGVGGLGGLQIGGLSGLGGLEAEIIDLSQVEPEDVHWLWPGYIPLKALTIFDGDPGLGKSTITGADIAARVSRGLPMPDGQRGDLSEPAGVVLMSLEDDTASTLVPRLIAAGADLTRVRQLRSVGRERALPNVEDVAAIELAVEQVQARLLIIDPIAGHLPKWANPNQDKDVRTALMGLARLAQDRDLAVVVVRHLTKTKGGGNPLYRGQASIAFIAAARSGVVVAEDPDDPKNRRVLASTKHNLSQEPPSLSYRMETADNGVVRVAWLAVHTEHTAETLLAPRESPEEQSRLKDAINVLEKILADGAVAAPEVKRQTDQAQLAWRTVERAKSVRGIQSIKTDAGWMWAMPDEAKTANDQAEQTPSGVPDEGKTANEDTSSELKTAKTANENKTAKTANSVCDVCLEPATRAKGEVYAVGQYHLHPDCTIQSELP